MLFPGAFVFSFRRSFEARREGRSSVSSSVFSFGGVFVVARTLNFVSCLILVASIGRRRRVSRRRFCRCVCEEFRARLVCAFRVIFLFYSICGVASRRRRAFSRLVEVASRLFAFCRRKEGGRGFRVGGANVGEGSAVEAAFRRAATRAAKKKNCVGPWRCGFFCYNALWNLIKGALGPPKSRSSFFFSLCREIERLTERVSLFSARSVRR